MKLSTRLFATILLALLAALDSNAATIHVPSEAPTIAAGLDLAAPGDSVLVAPGTYYETWLILPRGVVIASEAGPGQTILDGSLAEYGVPIFYGVGVGPQTELTGFTLRSAWEGIRLSFSAPRIGGNVFRDLVLAIDAVDSSPEITGNVFHKVNGGVLADGSAPIVISQNTFWDIGDAITIHTQHPAATIDHNILARCFLAVFCPGGADCPETLAFRCNDVWDSKYADFYGFIYDPIGLNGNFSADPGFCGDGMGDFTLKATSPCAPDLSPPGCGLVGALPVGCEDPTATSPVTWGVLKVRFQ